jgi:hypothetical protein
VDMPLYFNTAERVEENIGAAAHFLAHKA